jgi:hypothetical protein
MRVVNSRHALVAAVACAALIAASPALANTISTDFNFVPTGTITATDTGNNIATATFITSGAPDQVTQIITDNTGLVASQVVSLTSPTPVTMGADFTKTFTTALGVFTESLTVTSVTAAPFFLGISASGTIVETTVLKGAQLDPSPVTYSAAYTQNPSSGQLNASFNDATVPGPIVGAGLPGLLAACGALVALARRRRRQAA